MHHLHRIESASRSTLPSLQTNVMRCVANAKCEEEKKLESRKTDMIHFTFPGQRPSISNELLPSKKYISQIRNQFLSKKTFDLSKFSIF
jgi:hypothetical protein